MRIVHLGKYFWPEKGGVENYTLWLAEAARKKGDEVFVLCANTTNKEKREIINGINVWRLPLRINFFRAPITPPIISLLRGLNPDIIHLHAPNPWFEFNLLLYRLFKRTKIVTTYHMDIMNYTPVHFIANGLRLLFFLPLLGLSSKIIATSPDYAKGSWILKLFKKKVRVIPLSIDEHEFKPSLKVKQKKKMLLYVGRLAKYKGLNYLIDAVSRLSKQREDFYLVIVGKGKLKEKLMKQVEKLKLQKYVKFDYDASDAKLKEYYHHAHSFILPSTSKAEAFGIVQLEAMACGVPVISTQIKGSGVPFVNHNGETGIVVKPKSAEALANAMETLLDNEVLAKKLGGNARKRVLRYFTRKRMLDETFKIYSECEAHKI